MGTDLQIESLEERRVLAVTMSWVSSPPVVRELDLDGSGEREETIVSFTFQVTGELEEWTYVDWETLEDGPPEGAEPGSDPGDPNADFFEDAWQVWFEPGTQWDPVTVEIRFWGDLDPELNETFKLGVSSGDSINITNSGGIVQTATVIDNDNLYNSPDKGCPTGDDGLLTGDNYVGAGDGSGGAPDCGCFGGGGAAGPGAGGGASGAGGVGGKGGGPGMGGAPGSGQVGAPLPAGMGPSYSATLNPHPIITLETGLWSGEQVPTSFNVKLRLYSDTVNYVQTPTKTYDATGLQATDPLRFTLQVDATGFSTGRYRWEMDVTRVDSGVEGATSTHHGHHMLVSRLGSPYGDGRWLDGLDALYVADPLGVALVHSTGRTTWFEREPDGDLINTENGIASLVQNGNGTYMLTYRDGNVAEFSSAGALLARRDRNGNEKDYESTNGLLTTVRDVSGRETTFAYSSGKLATSTDFAGNVVEFSYTGDKLSSIIWPAPQGGAPRPTVTFVYAPSGVAEGLLTQVTDELGNQTSYTYDNFRRLASTTRPTPDGAGTYTTLVTSLQSEAAASTDPDGADERQGSYTDQSGREFVVETDERGQITHWTAPATDPQQDVVEIERCGCGRIESMLEHDPDGLGPRTDELTKYAYADTDFPGQPTEIRYVIGSVDPLNGEDDDIVYRFEYDTNGQVTKYTDPQNRVTSYTLDAAGNVLTETQEGAAGASDDLVTRFTYTSGGTGIPAGLLASRTDPNGDTTFFEYYDDSAGLSRAGALRRVIHPDTPQEQVAFAAATDVIDNGETGFTATGNWTLADTVGYDEDRLITLDPNATAEWSFTVTPGRYLVSSTWDSNPQAYANDALFTIFDGSSPRAATLANQAVHPFDLRDDAQWLWENLGVVNITGNSLVVKLDVAAGDGYTLADAVRIQRFDDLPSAPEVAVFDGDWEVADETGYASLGTANTGSRSTRLLPSSTSARAWARSIWIT